MYTRECKRQMMREWRTGKKTQLEILRVKANSKDATTRVKLEYKQVCKTRKEFLDKEKKRVKFYRQKLKRKYAQYDSATPKQQQNEDLVVKRLYENKVKKNKWKQNQRNKIRLSIIKDTLSTGKNINSRWAKFHKTLLTPLGSCIKTNDLIGVKFLLNSRASPVKEIDANGSKPLDESA